MTMHDMMVFGYLIVISIDLSLPFLLSFSLIDNICQTFKTVFYHFSNTPNFIKNA